MEKAIFRPIDPQDVARRNTGISLSRAEQFLRTVELLRNSGSLSKPKYGIAPPLSSARRIPPQLSTAAQVSDDSDFSARLG